MLICVPLMSDNPSLASGRCGLRWTRRRAARPLSGFGFGRARGRGLVTKAYPSPIVTSARWASGARSPLAPTLPCSGMAGTTPRLYISIERVDQFRRDAGVALGQGLDAQRQRQPADAEAQQRPHADGVAAQQVFLKGENFVRLDALVGQLAEAGVDAVDGGAGRHQRFEDAASLLDALAGGGGQGQALDGAAEDVRRHRRGSGRRR